MDKICPFTEKSVGPRCENNACPFHSLVNHTGCWHGDEITIKAIANNRRIKQIEIKEYLLKVEKRLKKWVAVYRYATWCGETTPSEADIRAWNKRRNKKPFSLPIFGFMTVERFARMRQLDALNEWASLNQLDPSIKLRKILEI